MANPFNALTTKFTSSIDPAIDSIPFWQGSTNQAFWINRNTFLDILSDPVGTTDTQVLTNKTITSPAISGPVLSGTITGTYTLGGTPTFPSSVVTLTGTQALTNKTLTGANISGGSLDNATVTVDSISGHTVFNTGTIYGVSITGGAFGSNVVSTLSVQDAAITAPKLSTGAIFLGSTSIVTPFSTASTSVVQVTGLTISVTIPDGNRKTLITVYSRGIFNATADTSTLVNLWDGPIGTGDQIQEAVVSTPDGSTSQNENFLSMSAIVSPSAGAKTYNVGMLVTGGTGNLRADATFPAFILVQEL